MADLVYDLQQVVLGAESTNVGFELYEGGNVLEHGTNRRFAVFTMFTKTISGVTNSAQQGVIMDTGALELQLFAERQGQGQRPGVQLETIVLQGAPSQLGGTPGPTPPANGPAAQPAQGRPVIRAAGSVSAATPMWQDRIGHEWIFENGRLTIR